MTALWPTLRAASRAILIAHTCKTLFALVLLGGFGRAIADIASRDDFVEIARYVIQEAKGHAAAAQWTALLYLLAGPLLAQYVLAALLRRPEPAHAALVRYGRALALSVLRWGALAGVAGAAIALAHGLGTRVPPELETVARFTALGLGAALLAWLATAHDAAAAQLAADDAPRVSKALPIGARASTLALVVTHLAFMLGVGLSYAAGEAASRSLWPALGFALAQACALGTAFIHAAWQAKVIDRIGQLTYTDQ